MKPGKLRDSLLASRDTVHQWEQLVTLRTDVDVGELDAILSRGRKTRTRSSRSSIASTSRRSRRTSSPRSCARTRKAMRSSPTRAASPRSRAAYARPDGSRSAWSRRRSARCGPIPWASRAATRQAALLSSRSDARSARTSTGDAHEDARAVARGRVGAEVGS